jgi:hypothetical protein
MIEQKFIGPAACRQKRVEQAVDPVRIAAAIIAITRREWAGQSTDAAAFPLRRPGSLLNKGAGVGKEGAQPFLGPLF